MLLQIHRKYFYRTRRRKTHPRAGEFPQSQVRTRVLETRRPALRYDCIGDVTALRGGTGPICHADCSAASGQGSESTLVPILAQSWVARANSFARGVSIEQIPSNEHRQTSWRCPILLSFRRHELLTRVAASRPKALAMAFFPIDLSHRQAALDAATHPKSQGPQEPGTKPTSLAVPPGCCFQYVCSWDLAIALSPIPFVVGAAGVRG